MAKKKIVMIWLAFMLVASLVIVGCAAPPAKPGITPTVLKFAHYFSPVDFRHETIVHWAELVEERSDGQIKTLVFPAEQLVKGKEGITSTAAGVCDLYSVLSTYAAGVVPITDYFNIPLPAYTDEQMIEIVHEAWDLLDPAFTENNLKMLGVINSTGPSDFYYTVPIHTMEDLVGMKTRGAGGMGEKAMKLLGLSVAFMSAAEQYMALQTKTVDGTTTTYMSYTSWKLYEVAPYWIKCAFTRGPYFALLNLDTWKKFSPEAQQILVDATADTEQWMLAQFGALNEELMDEMRPFITEEVDLSKAELDRWRAKIAPVKDEWVARVGADADALIAIGDRVMK